MNETYTLSKRKSIADDMGYQAGKLYEVCDAYNKINTKWLYWGSTDCRKSLFKPATGAIMTGDVAVFLGFENNFIKLLIDNGLVVYVAYVSDMVLKPVKTP